MKRIHLLSALLIAGLLLAVAPVFAQGPTDITLWRHTPDKQAEGDVFAAQVAAFNASQSDWNIVQEDLPQGSYTDSVNAAALSDSLPCVLDMDGPTVPNFAWSGNIASLDDYVTEDMKTDLLPSAIGTYKDSIYSLGQFDAAVAIWGRRSILEEAGIRIPMGVDDPWTLDEFNAALETLKNMDQFDTAIDMFNSYSGEWWPYAFSPILQSFGGDLIDRSTYLTAEGVLNGPEALAWGEWWQNLFQSGLADPNPADDQAFIQGRAALAYIGNWYYPTILDAWGDDLVIMPPVDFGNGPVVGGASWQWGISSSCEHPDGAWAFLDFLLQPEQVAGMSNVTGLIPATASGAALSDFYGPDGPLSIFVDISKKYAKMRPPTPAYPVISSTFESAAREISLGADVQNTLDDAVDTIDQNIADNNGYGFGDQ
jgi:multiple sugar transport system substrate-binding protein